MLLRRSITPLFLCLMACTDPATTDSEESGTSAAETETGTETDTGTETGTETGEEPDTRGLPEGESTWTGHIEVNGFVLDTDVTLMNTGGDIEAIFRLAEIGDFALTGTHEPVSGLIALSPDDWLAPPALQIELFGFIGSYDPDTMELSGMSADFATFDDNVLRGGPGSLTLTEGDGPPTAVGDEGAALTGSHNLIGTTQCSASERESGGTITYDGAGAVSGMITLGDLDLASPLGTFEFTGVHNPSTGGITLVPGLWTDANLSVLTFFVDGSYDPATGMFDGDLGSNANSCIPDGWHMIVE